LLLGVLAIGAALVANYAFLQRKSTDGEDTQYEMLRGAIRWIAIASVVLLCIEFVVLPIYLAYLGTGSAAALTSLGLMAGQINLVFILRLVLGFIGAGPGRLPLQNAASSGQKILGYLAYNAFVLVRRRGVRTLCVLCALPDRDLGLVRVDLSGVVHTHHECYTVGTNENAWPGVWLLVFACSCLILHAGTLPRRREFVHVLTLSGSGYERANSLAFSSDGRYLAAGGLSGIYLFDYQQLSAIDYIETKTWARSLAFLPGTNTFAAGLFDHSVKFWDAPTLTLLRSLDGPAGWVRSVSVSGDGSRVASAPDDNTLRCGDITEGTPVLVIGDVTGIRAVALSPDGGLVAGALGDKTVRVWRVPGGDLLYTLSGHTDWPRCLVFSPDGSMLASGSFDKTIRLWNMADGSEQRTLEGHTSSVLGIAFSPDGKTLASGSVDQTVRLWQVDTGETLQFGQRRLCLFCGLLTRWTFPGQAE
jgi:WD40 repeat protein